jgi:hypothetical protein
MDMLSCLALSLLVVLPAPQVSLYWLSLHKLQEGVLLLTLC